MQVIVYLKALTSDSDLRFRDLCSEVTAVLSGVFFGHILDDQSQRLARVKELILWSGLQNLAFLSPSWRDPGFGHLTRQSYHALLFTDDVVKRLEEDSKLLWRGKIVIHLSNSKK